jgi:hypothetical protein
VPDGTVRRIVERAEGNAFYAEELLAATSDHGGGSAVPSGLADVLLIRFEQLSDTAQQVLRTAAVAGRRVEHDLLRDAVQLPEEELESALREAVGRQLLVPGDDDTYSFRHALIREAVYADLLPGERVRLHGAFAGCSPGAATRPRARRSAPTTTARATTWPRRWPPRWRPPTTPSVRAPAEELRHLETASTCGRRCPPPGRAAEGTDTVTLTLRASAAAAHAGETHRAVSLTRSALAGSARTTDSELAARVRYTLAGNLMRVDNLTAAFAYSSEALAMIPAEPPSRTWVWAAATHVLAARQVGEDEIALRVARRPCASPRNSNWSDARPIC